MKTRILCIFLTVFFAFQTILPAEDASVRLREEEIRAKEAQVGEFSNRVLAMQKQLEEDRRALSHSQEKLWQDFTQGLEAERKSIQEKLASLDARQKAFENELARKRQEDEVRLKDKESETARLNAQAERLRADIENDQKLLQARLVELRNQPQLEGALKGAAAASPSNEVLPNRAIKISQMSGREMMGEAFSGPRRVQGEYYVDLGDSLAIDVWRVPDLTRLVVVRPDGRISMPVVGDLHVLGLSLVQVKELLTQKFSEYVWNPQVSISIQGFGGRKFIILGEVRSAGVYRFQQDLSLMEAIALAGGFTASSKRGKIMIIRGNIHKDPQVKLISANLENVLKKGMLSENLAILPNDIIYVNKDILGDYRDVIDQFISPTLSVPTDFFVLRSAIVTAKNRRF